MGRIHRFLVLAVIAGISVATFHNPSWAQLQVTLNAHEDNTLYESATGAVSNGAGQAFFVGRTGQVTGSIRRGLLAFPIAENIPQGSAVISVTLTLHMSRTAQGAPATMVEMHRALANWGEGTANADGNEGSGAPATTNDATWIHRFFDATTWTQPGGDFQTQSSASQSVAGVGSYTWGSTSQLVSEVQQWLDDPASNFGWVMIGDESTPSTSKRFDADENIDPGVRPHLTVTYQPVLAGVEPQSRTPASFALLQNYPNPFNPTTTVRYSVGGVVAPSGAFSSGVEGRDAGRVRLAVYDLLGREVAVLVDEQKEPGNYAVTWDARGMASGVYLYQIHSGNFVQTQRMILVR